MRAHFEKVPSGHAPFVAFERADSEFPFYWHFHPEYELTLITQSFGQRLVGNGIADYTSGDLVLLGPNLPHSWRSGPVKTARHEIHRAVVIQFREDFLGEYFFSLSEMDCVTRLLQRSASGLSFGQTKTARAVMKRIVELPSLSTARRVLAFLSILMDLAFEPNAVPLSTDKVRPICRVEDQQRIDAICLHLNQHYEDKIDYALLSRIFHMDQSSLCRFFKRATGRTMTEYVNELRIGAAAQLLTSTGLSTLEIALRVGFENYSNFNRQFNKIKGVGPRVLRRQFFSAIPENAANALVQ